MVKYDFFGQHLDRLQCYELLPADDIDMVLTGDLLFKIRSGHSFSNSTLCRFSINTAFIGPQEEFKKEDLDPTQFKKDNRFADYFTLSLLTEKGCPTCHAGKDLNDL